jgi:uncharacterized repeat protein (TIGR03806 family)
LNRKAPDWQVAEGDKLRGMNRLVAASLIAAMLGGCVNQPAATTAAPQVAATPVAQRLPARPYLNMPDTATGALPALLSQTGAYGDLRALTPAPGLMPYDLVVSFWSDGAAKSRYAAVPQAGVAFSPEGEWKFPPGTVFVKTFELPLDATQPQRRRRLETRLLVVDRDGGVYGVTYKWRADLSDAELLADSATEEILVRDAQGRQHTQTWYYPARQDCLACHNSHTPGQLGPKTRQLNRELHYPDGTTENQLRRWNRLGLFTQRLAEQDFASLPALARADDASRSIEDRARSYLDANCSHCHRPGGTVANFDARYSTPLAQQQIIDGPVLIDQGVDRARVVSPHDPWRSVMVMRVDTNDDLRMPPLARKTIDVKGVALLRQWVESLPGRDVLAPPSISPQGGSFNAAVTVTLSSNEPGAEIRYTLDGSAPRTSDARYEKPIRIEGPAVLRARAYKDGLTRSVIAQQTYVIEQ